nr:MAG TPA: hypothetical protein [Caudoviricetes sp.]
MQAALRFIGTNLRGFSLSRTHGLTPWHRRRLNISAILWFFVPQSDGKGGLPLHPLPQRGVTLARCGAAVYPVRRCGAGAACPCTLYRKGGSPPRRRPCQRQKKGGGIRPRRCAVSVQFSAVISRHISGVKPIFSAFACT